MNENKHQVQSVLRALDILEYLANQGGVGRVSEIARAVGCSKNTAFRLLQTLKERDFVLQTGDSSYELTFKLLRLSERITRNTELPDIVRPYLQELVHLVGETASLAVRDGNEILYLDRVRADSPFQTSYSVGSRAKLYSTSLGKAILAYSPEDVVQQVIDGGLLPNTEFTVTDPEKLRAELREIATMGYALDNQENVLGIRCVSAPVFNHKGEVIAAISVSSLAVRIPDERIPEIAEQVMRTAAAISSRSVL